MKCLRCGKESKYDFCRDCKEIRRNAGAIVSQDKKKLIKLLSDSKWLNVEGFNKFTIYTSNITKYGKIILEFQTKKEYKILKAVGGFITINSLLIILWCAISIIIIRL